MEHNDYDELVVSALYPKINDVLYIQLDTGMRRKLILFINPAFPTWMTNRCIWRFRAGRDGQAEKAVHRGRAVRLLFNGRRSQNFFNSHVLSHHEDIIRLVRIKKPEQDQITKVQRRSFLRVQAERGSRYDQRRRPVSSQNRRCWRRWRILSSAPDQAIAEGSILSCWILIPFKNGSVEHVPFEGEVVRVKELPTNRSIVMLKFNQIADMERQKLIRYCFERQFDFRNR